MQDYLRSLLLVAAVSVLAGLLLPEKNERMKRLLEFALALLVLTVVCRPLSEIDLFTVVPDGIRFPAGDGVLNGADDDTRAAVEQAVADGIEADLATRYHLPTACFSAEVSLHFNGKELTISSLTLRIRGEGRLLDLYAVRDYAARAYQTNCEVIADGG